MTRAVRAGVLSQQLLTQPGISEHLGKTGPGEQGPGPEGGGADGDTATFGRTSPALAMESFLPGGSVPDLPPHIWTLHAVSSALHPPPCFNTCSRPGSQLLWRARPAGDEGGHELQGEAGDSDCLGLGPVPALLASPLSSVLGDANQPAKCRRLKLRSV